MKSERVLRIPQPVGTVRYFDVSFLRTVFIPNSFYPERFLTRTVLIPTGRFSEIRNKNISDQNPFGPKNFMISKNSPKLYVTRRGQIWHVCHGYLVTSRKIINPNGYFSERFLFRKVFFFYSEFSDKNLSE